MGNNERRDNLKTWERLTTPKNKGVISLLGVIEKHVQLFVRTNVRGAVATTMTTRQKWGTKSERDELR